MLNFILDTFKNNPKLNAVMLDDIKLMKSDFDNIDKGTKIIKIKDNCYLNLESVQKIEFVPLLTADEGVRNLQRQADLCQKII